MKKNIKDTSYYQEILILNQISKGKLYRKIIRNEWITYTCIITDNQHVELTIMFEGKTILSKTFRYFKKVDLNAHNGVFYSYHGDGYHNSLKDHPFFQLDRDEYIELFKTNNNTHGVINNIGVGGGKSFSFEYGKSTFDIEFQFDPLCSRTYSMHVLDARVMIDHYMHYLNPYNDKIMQKLLLQYLNASVYYLIDIFNNYRVLVLKNVRHHLTFSYNVIEKKSYYKLVDLKTGIYEEQHFYNLSTKDYEFELNEQLFKFIINHSKDFKKFLDTYNIDKTNQYQDLKVLIEMATI